MTELIESFDDVAEHFDCDATNPSLSRRLYKSTGCGAWGEVVERAKTRKTLVKWTARYKRTGGTWALVQLASEATGTVSPEHAPTDARAYFWPWEGATPETINADFDELFADEFKDADAFESTVTIEVAEVTGSELVFRVGSIVEGTDAEVQPEEVVLPATPAQLDAAVAAIEAGAEEIWDDTHACEDCNAPETCEHCGSKNIAQLDSEWECHDCGETFEPSDTRVNPDCESCGGEGTII